MKLTVGKLLQLVHSAIAAEPDSFGKNACLRRLARLDVSAMNNVVVNVPKPEMSQEAKELLKNSQKVEPGPSKKARKPKGDEPKADVSAKDTPVVKLPPVRKRKPRGRTSRPHKQEV